ncbi:small ribosomal subunit protein uS9m-like isoform X1 [Branchiostoma floridae x Branchiostoma japonicum]
MAAPMVHGTVTACGRLLLRFSSPLLRDIYGNGQNAMLKTKQTQRCLSISAPRHRQQTKSTSSLSDKPYTEEFLQEMDQEYQLGKRHLANMMGEDPETFTQEDVDRAIRYLLPSGLHEKLARPMLKPPDQIFPKQKALQWGKERRPFSFLFYTGKANYYSLMHEAAQILTQLNRHEDKMLAKGVLLPDPEPWPEFNTSVWIDKIAVEKMITESMDDHQYRRFVEMLEHIAAHPYAKQAAQFILKFRQELVAVSMKQQVHPLMYDENGIAYMEAEGKRKSSRAKVTLRDRGTGEVTVNGLPLVTYLRNVQDREQVMLPLEFVERLDQFDVEATVWWGGTSGQAGAIRLAISRALCSFLTEAEIENMRLAGLLTTDLRRKERKKPGQKRARKKFSWRKR